MASPVWDLRERSMLFAVAVCRLCRALPLNAEGQDIARQLRRSACSLAANYRAARRGKSYRDFAAKLGTVIEEADEAHFWLELVARIGLVSADAVKDLTAESHELTAIFTAARKSTFRTRDQG